MKFVIMRASSDSYATIKYFPTTEDLINFKKKQKHDLIITDNPWYNCDIKLASEYLPKTLINEIINIPYEILIYDDYIE